MPRELLYYASRGEEEISCRIDELEREWDIEPMLKTNASIVAFAGLALGTTVNKKWLILPGLVLPFLFQHAAFASFAADRSTNAERN